MVGFDKFLYVFGRLEGCVYVLGYINIERLERVFVIYRVLVECEVWYVIEEIREGLRESRR